MVLGSSFDFGTAHVAAIKSIKESFTKAMPHATVAITMGVANLTDPVEKAEIDKCYPIPELAEAADQIFIMSYDMWHHHQVCAGPNSPLPALSAGIHSFSSFYRHHVIRKGLVFLCRFSLL